MTLGDKIKEQRCRIGMKQSDLANVLGVSGSAVGNWEQGTNKPNVDLISNMCYIFNVSPDYFFDVNLDKKNPPQRRRMTEDEKEQLAKDLTAVLGKYGFIGEGGEITDTDFEMIKGLILLLVAYRKNRS